MKIKSFVIFLMMSGIALSGTATQPMGEYPLFHHDLVIKAANETLKLARIDIFAEVLYDDLQFVKTAEDFEANYELSAVLMQGNDQVDGKIWKETVVVDSYDRTNSRGDISLTYASFNDVEPGKYKVILSYEDLESSQTYSIEQKIKVEDFSKPAISGSSITFARKVEIENNQIKSIFPEVTNTYKGLGAPSYAYFEVYNPKGYQTGQVS